MRIFLRVWTPKFASLNSATPFEIEINKAGIYSSGRIHRWESSQTGPLDDHFTLDNPILFPETKSYERVFALPAGLKLAPQTDYKISGWLREPAKKRPHF